MFRIGKSDTSNKNIENKLNEVHHKLDMLVSMQQEKIISIETMLRDIKESFVSYKKDVMCNMERIIDTIYKDTQCYKDNVVFSKVITSQQVLLGELYAKLKEDTTQITRTISLHNNENEIMRQNLNIQEDLRRCEDDLVVLEKQLKSTMSTIDTLLQT
jgi:hypothetical protein